MSILTNSRYSRRLETHLSENAFSSISVVMTLYVCIGFWRLIARSSLATRGRAWRDISEVETMYVNFVFVAQPYA